MLFRSQGGKNKKIKIGFQNGAADEGRKYSKFFRKNFESVDDVHDHEKISVAIKKVLSSFKEEIDAVAEILPEFKKHGKEASSQ